MQKYIKKTNFILNMNEKHIEETQNVPFDGIVIDADEVIARNEQGLPPQEEGCNMSPEELQGVTRYKKLNILLGEGGFKKVYKAVDQVEGKEVAWNEIKISENEYNNREKTSFCREITLLNRMNHPSILTILNYWFTKEKFVFITEIMSGGTLREFIAKIGEVNIKIIQKWARQILEGLDYLHSQDPPIIHRDIKCENIFVDSSTGEVKIGDLGVAKERKLKRYTVVGTPQFMAREMFEGDGYNEKVDIYAFGMCLIEMATGSYPYKECGDSSDVYRSILQGVPPAALYSVANPCLKNLILRCLVLEKDRLGADEALKHHFLDPESTCPGDCIPKESILVKPLTTPGHDMEISLIGFEDDVIIFQLFFMSEAKFIKFDFNVKTDTVEVVAREMIEEKIVISSKKDVLINMLQRGVIRAIEKKEAFDKELLAEDLDLNIGVVEKSNMISMEAEISNLNLNVDHSYLNNVNKSNAYNISDAQKIQSNINNVPCNENPNKDYFDEKKQSCLDDKLQNKNFDSNMDSISVLPKNKEKVVEQKIGKIYFDGHKNCNISQNEIKTEETKLIDTEGLISNQFYEKVLPQINLNESLTDNKKIIDYKEKHECNLLEENNKIVESKNNTEKVGCEKCCLTTSETNGTKSPVTNTQEIVVSNITANVEEQKQIMTNRPAMSSTEELTCKTMVYPIKKYDNNIFIEEFAYDTAEITRRTPETAKNWIKILRNNDIYNTTDLKFLVDEDWDKLGLSVFISRAMKNMLYGLDQHPLKEKQLADNPSIKIYPSEASITEFLLDATEMCNKKECFTVWENKLLAQDIRTIEELKSLHQEDWDRLGLSLFSYRVLKNIIFRKGKFM